MAFSITIQEQLILFVYAMIIGAVIGVIYDIFRISRVMITGVGIGGEKTSSARLEAISEKLSHGKKKTDNDKSKLGKLLVFVLIFLQDILFFLIASSVFIIFLYHTNYGQTRLYIYFSATLGFLLYYNTLGRISARISGFTVSLFRLIYTFLLYKVLIPVYRLAAEKTAVPVNFFAVYRIKLLCSKEIKRINVISKNGFN